jgi:pilus assembly protein CpaE
MKRLVREAPVHSNETELGQTFTFFSYKGGIGNTFLACNTAVAIAQRKEARVLLWDLVMQNGDVPFFFDYTPVSTLTDLLENLPRIDSQYLQGTLPVQPSGISILAGPKRPEEAESIRNDQIQALHQVLRRHYDFIVVDGGHALTDSVIGVMDDSRHVMLTTNLHLPVLKNTLRCLEVFERLGYTEDKFKILLNRYNSKYEKFDLGKAEEILRYPIAFSVLNDYVTASRSLNAGIPVAELDGNSLLAKQFEGLADLLVNDFKAREKRASIFRRIFGGNRSGRKRREREAKEGEGSRAKDRGQDAA